MRSGVGLPPVVPETHRCLETMRVSPQSRHPVVLPAEALVAVEGVLRMKQSVALVTLGVADYARAVAFYEALGWHPKLQIEQTAFFEANGVVLVLWSRAKLAADMGIHDEGASWSGITLAHNVGSPAEVEEVIDLARNLGATVTREPSETFYGGYAGGFLDLDGHSWEIAHNPSLELTADGSVLLPEP